MKAEEKKLLNAIKVAVFVLEPDDKGRPVYVAFNRLACKALKCSEADIVGQTAIEIYPGEFGRIAYKRHCQAVSSRKSMNYELTLMIDGQERQVRTDLRPIIDDNDNLTRIVGTSTDITAEHAVRDIQANSEMMNKELAEFISLAAHDLRSPIKNIRTLTDYLLEDFEDLGDGKLALIKMLESIAIKTTSLIGDVISHAQATNVIKIVDEFEISVLCHDTLAMLDPTGKHNIEVAECRLVGDYIAAQIVVRNLLDNAIKHNSDRSISMLVSVESLDSEMYQITINDDGAGFADPAVAFLDGGKLRTDSGFGLLGIRQLVTARGGKISAKKPEIGSGAVITLSLPGSLVDQLDLAV